MLRSTRQRSGDSGGALGTARLDGVRLFGRSQARVRLGRSSLSRAPVWSVGNPDHDPLNAGAFRFRVLVPGLHGDALRAQIAEVVESQKPAHTVATLHGGSSALVVGQDIHIGIDTALLPLPPPVLRGKGHGVRLGRNAVLWGTSRCTSPALRVGRGSAVGIATVME